MGVTGRRAIRARAREASLVPRVVTVDVDRMVLEGFDGLDVALVGDAFQEDLARLIEQELPPGWRTSSSNDTINGAPTLLASGPSSDEVGRLAATAVHGGMDGSARDPSKP